MSPTLEDELFTKYPKIFNGCLVKKHIECDDGWYRLLDTLCTEIQGVIDDHPEIPQISAFEVKHANDGGLRFYYNGGDLTLFEAVNNAETKSYHICEVCGGKGNLNVTRAGTKCLCPQHRGGLEDVRLVSQKQTITTTDGVV